MDYSQPIFESKKEPHLMICGILFLLCYSQSATSLYQILLVPFLARPFHFPDLGAVFNLFEEIVYSGCDRSACSSLNAFTWMRASLIFFKLVVAV